MQRIVAAFAVLPANIGLWRGDRCATAARPFANARATARCFEIDCHKVRHADARASSRATALKSRTLRNMPIVLTMLASALVLTPASADEYRLSPGDTIEFSTVATPDLRTRAPIRLDGRVTLPLVGDIEVAGLTIEQLNAKLQEDLATKVYRRRSDDGREIPVMIGPGEVTVTIAEYRPVYVNGDVSKPGEQPYRPGLTVRQAIALAGGYDVMHIRMQNPFLEQADLHGDYESLWTDFAKQQAVIQRLEAELKNADTIDHKALLDTPIPPSLAKRIIEIEEEQLAARNAVYRKDREYLEYALKKEDHRIAILADQQNREKEGVDADIGEYTRVKGLFDKQTLPITRVVDARRTILFSSTRYLQTIVEKGRAERGRDELQSRLDKLADNRRRDVLLDLQDANVKLATTRARLKAVGEKLVYTGLVRSQLVRGEGSNPEVLIHRKGNEPIVADQDNELQPGDVVDVALQRRMLLGDEEKSPAKQSKAEAGSQ